jgi:hypothetical protein
MNEGARIKTICPQSAQESLCLTAILPESCLRKAAYIDKPLLVPFNDFNPKLACSIARWPRQTPAGIDKPQETAKRRSVRTPPSLKIAGKPAVTSPVTH